MSDYFKQYASVSTDFVVGKNWAILSSVEAGIKHKIEAIGIPLRDWNIQINRGIITGLNEAFLIDEKTKDILIEKSPKNAEIIRPILRGKDIKRYNVEFGNIWLLFIPWHFPLHKDPTITGASQKAEDAFKDQYPDIYNHLTQFKKPLSERNKSETGIRYEWYALQRYGSNYWQDFEKPKITWGNLALKSQFAYTDQAFIVNAPSPFFATENLYLLAVLNSKVSDYCIKNLGVERNGGYFEYKPMFVEQIPIPKIEQREQDEIGEISSQILNLKKLRLPTEKLESELNKRVYQVYELTEQEIEVIESLCL